MYFFFAWIIFWISLFIGFQIEARYPKKGIIRNKMTSYYLTNAKTHFIVIEKGFDANKGSFLSAKEGQIVLPKFYYDSSLFYCKVGDTICLNRQGVFIKMPYNWNIKTGNYKKTNE